MYDVEDNMSSPTVSMQDGPDERHHPVSQARYTWPMPPSKDLGDDLVDADPGAGFRAGCRYPPGRFFSACSQCIATVRPWIGTSGPTCVEAAPLVITRWNVRNRWPSGETS